LSPDQRFFFAVAFGPAGIGNQGDVIGVCPVVGDMANDFPEVWFLVISTDRESWDPGQSDESRSVSGGFFGVGSLPARHSMSLSAKVKVKTCREERMGSR
jgi:hypothetical protein